MAILENDYGDTFANIPANYLQDYSRRTGTALANISVENRIDPSTGRQMFYIHNVADSFASTDPSNPVAINLAPNDPEMTAVFLAGS